MLDRRRVIAIELGEGEGGLQVMLGVGAGAATGAIEADPVSNAGQDVVQIPSIGRVIEDLGAGNEGDVGLPRPGAEPAFAWYVLGLAMTSKQSIEPVVERIT